MEKVIKKRCSKCEKEKPLGDFHKNKSRRYKIQAWCKKCKRQYDRSVYHGRSPKLKQQILAGRERSKKRNQKFILGYLRKHLCSDCGENDIRVLEFDHISGEKERDISCMVRNGWGLVRIKKEIKKCDVVCANCHRKRTYAREDSWRNNMGA